jgi:hypothetical protein
MTDRSDDDARAMPRANGLCLRPYLCGARPHSLAGILRERRRHVHDGDIFAANAKERRLRSTLGIRPGSRDGLHRQRRITCFDGPCYRLHVDAGWLVEQDNGHLTIHDTTSVLKGSENRTNAE